MKLVDKMLGEYGLREIPGVENNPRIMEYFRWIGHSWVQDDEVAWCSAFLNWACLVTGLPRSGKLDARSWLSVGTPVYDPVLGDVVVLWRESVASWKGHVGVFIRQTDDQIYLLGGNQNNEVCIKPYSGGRLLGYRRLI